jgi:hypothetical protein
MANTVKTKSSYENLSSINVREKVERKGQMDYLSWANAWHMLKQNYPGAKRIVYEDPATGWNYFTDGRSAWVKVGIVVGEMEHIDYLPVMDFRNNALAIEKVSATDVNKTIQRSTAKAIAMHGLGLSLWTGEDVPEMVTTKAPEKKSTSKPTLIELKVDDDNWVKVLKYVAENKQLGLKKIGDQLQRKYKISASAKTEIANVIKSK